MGFQWTAIAFVLYAELAVVCILMLPFISAQRWKALFESRIGQGVKRHANYYFHIFIALLGLVFFDSIREMRKYAYSDKTVTSMHNQPAAMDNLHMKQFRAQRNFYISGFALFLWIVISRLVTMISTEASQAERINNEAVVEQQPVAEADPELLRQLENAQMELGETKEELTRTQLQLTQQKEEFDELCEKYQEMEMTCNTQQEGGSGDKKTE